MFGYIFSEKVPIDTFYLLSYSTHNKQQAGIIIFFTEEREKVMTATNMCSIFLVSGVVLPF